MTLFVGDAIHVGLSLWVTRPVPGPLRTELTFPEKGFTFRSTRQHSHHGRHTPKANRKRHGCQRPGKLHLTMAKGTHQFAEPADLL